MAHFCEQTGVRIAGPGIVDTYERADGRSIGNSVQRHPEVVEIDGREITKAEADRLAAERAEAPTRRTRTNN